MGFSGNSAGMVFYGPFWLFSMNGFLWLFLVVPQEAFCL
jgi:hypothetical protein